MAGKRKKYPPIRCVSAVEINGQLVYLDDMNDEQREYMGTKLTMGMLDAKYEGEVAFSAPSLRPYEEVFADRL